MIANTDEDIAKGIKQIIDLIQQKTSAKVLVLGILPRHFQGWNTGNKVIGLNAMIAKYDNGNTTRFLDMRKQFEGSTVDLVKTELYDQDQLHLNHAGYKMWAETMDPLLKKMWE